MLPIAIAQREPFALACEAYSRLLELGLTVTTDFKTVEEMREMFCAVAACCRLWVSESFSFSPSFDWMVYRSHEA